MFTALDALRSQASGAGPTEDCQLVEKLAALALQSCEAAFAAQTARPQDSAFAKELTEQMLALRNSATELLVVGCGRKMKIEELTGKGMPEKLGLRLNAAMGYNVRLGEHQAQYSRIGKAKYHCYTAGVCWGGKKKGTASSAALTIPAGTASREAAGSGDRAAPAWGEGADPASGEGAEVWADGGDWAQEEEDDEAVKALYLSI